MALVVARRRRRTVGIATAALLVAVFPANVYVAVAGIEVDGQPGGAYPWIRLPFQLLFIAWVAWSSRTPRLSPAETVVFTSVLQLERFRDVPSFLVATLKLRLVFDRTAGGVHLSLRADIVRKTFRTLSQWESQPAARRLRRTPRAHGGDAPLRPPPGRLRVRIVGP